MKNIITVLLIIYDLMISLNVRLVLLAIFLIFVIAGSLIVLEINRDVVINPYKKYVVTKKYGNWIVTSYLMPESIFSSQDFTVSTIVKYMGTRTYKAYVISPVMPEIIIKNALNGSIIGSFVVPSTTRLETIGPGTTLNFSMTIGPREKVFHCVLAPGKYIVEVRIGIPNSNLPIIISLQLRLNVR